MAEEQKRTPKHSRPSEEETAERFLQAIREAEERDRENDAYVLGRDEKLTRRIESLESSIEASKKELRHVGRHDALPVYECLTFLAALLVGALVVTMFALHLSELFGWGLTERFDALFQALRSTLLGMGGGDGPLHVVGQVLFFPIEVVVGVCVTLPLNILRFLQIIIPEPRVLMGVPEGVLIALTLWLVWALNPLATFRERRAQVRAERVRLRNSIKDARDELKAVHAMRDMIRSGSRYQHLVQARRMEEELEAQRRKAYSYIDKAMKRG